MNEQDKQYQEEDEIDLLELVGVLLRYKWLIIGLTGLAAVGVVLYSIISLSLPADKSPLPNQYKASALILINEDSGSSLSSMISSSGLSGLAGMAGVSGGGGSGQLAVKLLNSRSTLDEIADAFDIRERYNIQENPIGKTRSAIKGHASFEFESETSTVVISYEETDPEFARDVVNKFVEILEQRFESLGTSRNVRKKNLLEDKLAEVKGQIDSLATEIQEFQSKYGTLDVKALAQEQITMSAQLRSQLILKDVELETYRDISSINDPVIRRLEAERRNITQLLQEMETGYNQYLGVLPSQKELPELAYQFAEMERELDVQQKVYTALRQQYEIAKLNTEGEEPIFQVLEMAEAPDIKSGPSRGVLCIVVTMAAFFLSIFAAFVLNAIKNIKNDPERMRKLKGDK